MVDRPTQTIPPYPAIPPQGQQKWQQAQQPTMPLMGSDLINMGYDPNDPNVQAAVNAGATNPVALVRAVQPTQPAILPVGSTNFTSNIPNSFPQGNVQGATPIPNAQPGAQNQPIPNANQPINWQQIGGSNPLAAKTTYLTQTFGGNYTPQVQADLAELQNALSTAMATGEISPDQAAVLYEQIELATRMASQGAPPQQQQGVQPQQVLPQGGIPQPTGNGTITPPAFAGSAGLAQITPPRFAGSVMAGPEVPRQDASTVYPYLGAITPPRTGSAGMVQLSPDGRTLDQIRASGTYKSQNERLFYLNSIGKTLDSSGNVVPFNLPQPSFNGGVPELTSAAAPITVPDVNHGGTAVLQPPTLQAIMKYFPQSEWKAAMMIIASESKGNDMSVGGVGERGAFQINPGPNRTFWNEYSRILGTPVNEITLQNPDLNARVARLIWDRNNGWARRNADGSYSPNPWSTAPAVLRYLGR